MSNKDSWLLQKALKRNLVYLNCDLLSSKKSLFERTLIQNNLRMILFGCLCCFGTQYAYYANSIKNLYSKFNTLTIWGNHPKTFFEHE